jgi:hypothetical protein
VNAAARAAESHRQSADLVEAIALWPSVAGPLAEQIAVPASRQRAQAALVIAEAEQNPAAALARFQRCFPGYDTITSQHVEDGSAQGNWSDSAARAATALAPGLALTDRHQAQRLGERLPAGSTARQAALLELARRLPDERDKAGVLYPLAKDAGPATLADMAAVVAQAAPWQSEAWLAQAVDGLAQAPESLGHVAWTLAERDTVRAQLLLEQEASRLGDTPDKDREASRRRLAVAMARANPERAAELARTHPAADDRRWTLVLVARCLTAPAAARAKLSYADWTDLSSPWPSAR